ncbi:glycosyltransferase family 25 protein [uncultured Bartonella sp.]|uniref:glycosyltransferase family 25 protein n=1 Tax=uncultured Bartonella sp. TaxID=104108 RepID=UPI002609698E|nr:glycosyltransferase family 25 protein [uncultured Bartonella sp.]
MKRYVINLDRSNERLDHMKSVFNTVGLDFIRVSAVDGRALPEEKFEQLTRIRNWPKKLTKAEVGCFLSHLECLRLISEGDDPYGAVFEDDIKLSSHANLFLKNWQWIPDGCDLLKLDTAQTVCVLGKFNTDLPEGYRLARLVTKHYCAGGYIVSKSCAKRLYEENRLVTAPIDEIYYNPECGVMQTLNVEQLFPAIAMQVGLTSTIRSDDGNKKNYKRSSKSIFQKMQREFNRFKKRYFIPYYLKTFHGFFWGIVPFH